MGLRVPVQKAVPLIKASQTIELTPSTFRCSAEKPQLPLNIAKTAFIGSNIGPAGEYHDSDFSFEEHKRYVEDLDLGPEQIWTAPAADACHLDEPQAALCWEKFHAKDNATARFYKERRYLLLEFPILTDPNIQHVAEIGCGAGSSLLPILKANPCCRATGTDLSPTAIRMLKQAAETAGIAQDRITAFSFDSTRIESLPHPLHGLGADALLLIFTLAALSPAQMPAMLYNAYQALRPGGLLLLRDHGVYDLTHLRLSEKQRVGPRLFRRQDSTLCYFFAVEDLQSRMLEAGFEVVECKYACVQLRNRRRGLNMRRVFVHGVFKKPEDSVRTPTLTWS